MMNTPLYENLVLSVEGTSVVYTLPAQDREGSTAITVARIDFDIEGNATVSYHRDMSRTLDLYRLTRRVKAKRAFHRKRTHAEVFEIADAEVMRSCEVAHETWRREWELSDELKGLISQGKDAEGED